MASSTMHGTERGLESPEIPLRRASSTQNLDTKHCYARSAAAEGAGRKVSISDDGLDLAHRGSCMQPQGCSMTPSVKVV